MPDAGSSLQDWLGYIETVHPVGWDLGLERVQAVADSLDIRHPGSTTILVAGTNGKGSTCEYLAALAASNGLSCGKSTSPHLLTFNERIVINGEQATDANIVTAFADIERARGDITLTYFEFAALASMLLFARRGVEVAILEIGLGGRLDAMNIAHPDLSIITSISVDHQAWLGETREAIGGEKAGIMRPGVPCLIADRQPPASLATHAAALGTPVRLLGQDFDLPAGLPDPWLPADSLAAALAAAGQLGWQTNDAGDIAATTRLAGRRSWIAGAPAVLLDVAHNPAAAASLARYLESLELHGDVHALVGMYADKDIEQTTAALAAKIKTWHLTGLDDPRAAPAAELSDRLAGEVGGSRSAYAKIGEAVAGIRAVAGSNDLILVFGSFPVVAGAMQLLQ